MKIRNLILAVMMCFIMTLTGCLGLQIVSNPEASAGPEYIASIIATEYIKAKYPDKIKKLIALSDAVLNASTNKDIEYAFNEWKDSLADSVKDPAGKAAVKALLACYDIQIDGSAALDWGGRDKAIKAVDEFKKAVGAKS
jgi:hypothetical protein